MVIVILRGSVWLANEARVWVLADEGTHPLGVRLEILVIVWVQVCGL